MAVPKRRTSTGRKGRRRSIISLKIASLSPCPNCQKPKASHVACPSCGEYKGKKTK